MAWAPVYYNAEQFERQQGIQLTAAQHALLMPPSAMPQTKSGTTVWGRAQTEQAELRELRNKVASLEAAMACTTVASPKL